MGLLSERAKASIRAIRDRTFSTEIAVLARRTVPNGAGGQSEVWDVAASYSGRLRHARPIDYLENRGGQQLPVGTWFVMLPVEVSVSSANRIRAGGRTFTIVGTTAGRSDALVQTLICLSASEA